MSIKALGVSEAGNAWRRAVRKAGHMLAAAAYALFSAAAANAQVSQTPLYLGGGDVPGNLTLVPSVEWPTINSVANLGDYAEASTYLGYFDPRKCYRYSYNATESLRHFYPTATTSTHRCSGTYEWSGNYLNWAGTQTIDPFRWALTGGYRVVDSTTETWLEKARHDGQGGTNIFPNRRVPASSTSTTLVDGATPTNFSRIRTRIQGLGNKMRFVSTDPSGSPSVDPLDGTTIVQYDGGNTFTAGTVYEVSMRVKVCVSGLLEANCKQYGSVYKPEGLIQRYSDRLRIGVFGYLNDGNMLRDGGALRARQKFVGPTRITPGVGTEANPNVEWSTTTGQLITNPDSADATATAAALSITVSNSGAMNYLNKFGQLTSNNHKNFDPVSELYYAALRYLKHQANVPEYTNVPGNTSVGATAASDGFPIITNWTDDDPIQYTCQKNVILGIGDVYTHRDKNLPGSTYNTDEPSDPALVAGDDTIDVVAATNKVGSLEGLGNIGSTNNWSGRNNSAYLAGLAYLANTSDIRDDIPGTQTVSTHWVDVLEAQSLEPPNRNQYYLATKYGGLKIPDDVDFDPMTASASDIPLAWWHSPAPDNGETLAPVGRGTTSPTVAGFYRPDNYYLAGNASQMVASLQKAFERIATEVGRTSASSVAANSTRIDSSSAVFQATFNPSKWSGDLSAFSIDTQGSIGATPAWSAAAKLDALTATQIANRNILTIAPPTAAGDGSLVSTAGTSFAWASLAASQQSALQAGDSDLTLGAKRLAYLRGSRTDEDNGTGPAEPFRQRDSRLGDIVNSDPQLAQHDDFGYTLLDQSLAFNGLGAGAAYRTFRNSIANRTPVVVVGANDGMLHGFNASPTSGGGNELFAFVPAAAYANLAKLTNKEYEHRYFVDGTPRVADAWFGSAWHTIAVGSMGAGGTSYFALDITSPTSVTASDVLWEFTHPEMGATRGQAAVVPLPTGEFGVVITSGYNTGSTDGHIWFLDPANGSVIHTIDVPGSGDLGPPLLADLNNDRVADRLYVGDTDGNLWRFDLVGDDPDNWLPPADLQSSGDPLPLFVAEDALGNRQPITAPLTSAFNENGQHMVFFGTGSFYRVDDNVVPDDPPVDSFYGIIDRGDPTARGDLLEQEILAEVSAGSIDARGVTAREMTAAHDGWFLDLQWKPSRGGGGPIGERVVTRALVRGDRVVFSTLIPNPDPCESGGTSWLMELSTWTGGRLAYSVFDVNLDEDFDADDYITVTNEDGEEVRVPVTGRKDDDDGIIGQAAVIGIDDGSLAGDEIKVLSSSSGNLIRVAERGGVGLGRQSWRELR